jgi:hypothetical protein
MLQSKKNALLLIGSSIYRQQGTTFSTLAKVGIELHLYYYKEVF